MTDNHLEPPLEKVNKEVVFRNPTVRTLLNKSTLRTLPHLEPSLTIIYNIYIHLYVYIYICNLETQIYIYMYDFGSLGYAENLCRGTIKMLNTHQILYIYIRNRTVRTPPTINVFSKINEIFVCINLCRGTIKMLNTHQILYIYETAQLEPPPTINVFSKIKEIFISINLCRGTIKMLNTHQILYIYIRNRTVRTPPHHQRFFQNQ